MKTKIKKIPCEIMYLAARPGGRRRVQEFPFNELDTGEGFEVRTPADANYGSITQSVLNGYTNKQFKRTKLSSSRWVFWRLS